MSGFFGRVLDILFAALILGLFLRYSTEASQIIATTGKASGDLFAVASLQNISRNNA